MTEQVDVVVVGMGVGGEAVAGRLAEAGLQVVGIESRLVGGECPYWACIPTKMMVRAADLLAETRRVAGMAGDAVAHSDWAPVAHRIRDEATDDWDDRVAVDRFTGKGGRFARGHARITAPDEVTVDGQVFQARRGLVVATGSEPAAPPLPGLAETPYWTNRDAVAAEEVPGSLIVLGGGPVGLEFAQIFARFGTAVTIVEMAERLLPTEEPETDALLQAVLPADGIRVRTSTRASEVRHDGASFTVGLADGDTLSADRLLVATGRRTDLAALGAGAAGLDESARFVSVDEHLRAAPGVWAVGDVTGKALFTHTATYQADLVARDILGEDPPPADYRGMPRVTFTDPEIGGVGLTEARAREAGIRVRTGTAQIPASTRGWIHKAGNDGFIKLVADADRDVLVGATSTGPVGGEVLGTLVVAVHAQVPTEKLRTMIYAYPTFHRAIEDALHRLH